MERTLLDFGNYGDDPTSPNPSPEKDYLGNIQNAYWINAGDLEVGHKVLDDDGNWQTVTAVRVEQKPLNSYNLEVNIDHTFFIRGIGGLDGIWVHNKDCFKPDEIKQADLKKTNTKLADGRELHEYTYKAPDFSNKTRTITVYKGSDGKYYNYNVHKPTYANGYKANQTVQGPLKGKAEKTEFTTKNGDAIYQRVDKDGKRGGYYINKNGKQYKVDSPRPKADKFDTVIDYSWINANRHPDPKVQSRFVSSKPAPSTNQYFKMETQWQAPGRGTGLEYKVYQQDIDLNAVPNAHLGSTKTNAELMEGGNAPYVLKNGSYEQVQLHHNVQDGRGSIYELSKPPHQADNQSGGLALHPYGKNKHPEYPVNRPMFDKDRETYWKDRLNQLKGN